MNIKLKTGDRVEALPDTRAFFWSEGREGTVRRVHESGDGGLVSWGDDPTTLGFEAIHVVKITEVTA